MSKKRVAVVAVLVLLLAGASVFGFLVWKHKSEMVASPVSFTVVADGWSADSSSPVPLHVTGKTLGDEKVDVKYFLGTSDKDLTLKPGAYEVEVYASPVNTDGGMYRCSKVNKNGLLISLFTSFSNGRTTISSLSFLYGHHTHNDGKGTGRNGGAKEQRAWVTRGEFLVLRR